MDLNDLIKNAPLDWTDPRMRALLDAAVTFVPYPDDIVMIATAAGISPGDLPLTASGRRIWWSAFNDAAKHLKTATLVEQTAATSAAFADRVAELHQAEPPLPAHPAEPPATADYQGFSAAAKRERQIVASMPTLLDVRFLALGVERAKSICRIEAGFPGFASLGTGFRIGERTILTNHHVVFDETKADQPAVTVQVQFGKELGLNGQPLIPTTINGLAGAALHGERAHDWAVVELAGPPPAGVPRLPISGPGKPVTRDDRVTIIQHPKGLDKKIGITHNLVRYADANVVQYWTDTDEGSSGAPVFNENWEVVALHHASVEVGAQDEYGYRNQGRTIEQIAQRVALMVHP